MKTRPATIRIGSSIAATGAALFVALISFAPVNAQENQTPSKELTDSPARPSANDKINHVVADFFDRWRDGRATENESLFLSSETPIVGGFMDRRVDAHSDVWHKTARDTLKEWQQSPPKHLELDEVESEPFGDSLMITRVNYTGYGVKGRAVFTFSRESDDWKIMSLTLETRFNW